MKKVILWLSFITSVYFSNNNYLRYLSYQCASSALISSTSIIDNKMIVNEELFIEKFVYLLKNNNYNDNLINQLKVLFSFKENLIDIEVIYQIVFSKYCIKFALEYGEEK